MSRNSDLIINYPERRGYILQAHQLKQLLTACFDIHVEVAAHNDDKLTLIYNEETIHEQAARKDVQINFNEIAAILCRYEQPICEIAEVISKMGGGRDHDEDQWFNSVCSGE